MTNRLSYTQSPGRPHGLARRICGTAVALVAAIATAQDIRAADPTNPHAFIERVEAGWAHRLTPERWNPLAVWINGGEKGFTGVLSITFAQDGSQPARIVLPASATPGTTVPIDCAAVLPRGFREAEVELINQSGRRIDRTVAVVGFGLEGQLSLGVTIVERSAPIVAIGPCSILRTRSAGDAAAEVPTFQRPTFGDDPVPRITPEEAWRRLEVVSIEPLRLPRAWIAFDGLPALVIDAPAIGRIEARSLEAVRQWLLGGGRVVVLAPTAGGEWRRLMPAEPAYDLISVGEPESMDTPASLIEALAVRQEQLRRPALPAGETESGSDIERPSDEEASDPEPPLPGSDERVAQEGQTSVSAGERLTFEITPAAPRVAARAIALTPLGRASGWKTRWNVAGDGAGLLAEGPVGFGRLTVLGVDPERIAQTASKAASSALWLDAMPDVAENDAAHTPNGDAMSGSGATRGQAEAMNVAMNELVGDRTVGISTIVVIWFSTVLLAVLIGPLDAIVLRRLNASQRSWATALGWIGLVSLAAAYLPRVIRTAPTTLDRVRVLDIRLPEAGDRAPLAWQSGVSSLFGGKSADARVEGFAPRAWVRGVSAMGASTGVRYALPPLLTMQGAVPGGEPGEVANLPSSLWLGQWTMRAMLDQGPVESVIGGSLDRESGSPESAWRIRLRGLPPGAAVSKVFAWMNEDARGAAVEASEPGHAVGSDGMWSIDLDETRTSSYTDLFGEGGEHRGAVLTAGRYPAKLEQLPGADARGRVLRDLVSSGRWAVVCLIVQDDAGGVRLAGERDAGLRWSLVRICIPVGAGSEGGAR